MFELPYVKILAVFMRPRSELPVLAAKLRNIALTEICIENRSDNSEDKLYPLRFRTQSVRPHKPKIYTSKYFYVKTSPSKNLRK